MCAVASAPAASGRAHDKLRVGGHRETKRKGAAGSLAYRKARHRHAAGHKLARDRARLPARSPGSETAEAAERAAPSASPPAAASAASASPAAAPPATASPATAAGLSAARPPDARPQPRGGNGAATPSATAKPLPCDVSSRLAETAASGTIGSDAIRWPRVVPGGAGDHAAVHQLLTTVFHAPTRDAFYASLDDPFYEPHDRLLVKRGTQIISHLKLTKRVMHFGDLQFAVDSIGWLGTLPEFRRRGLAGQLLRTAEKIIERDGAVLGCLSTRVPRFFRPSGWAVCGRHSHARAGSRELLAQLSARGFAPGEGELSVRPWRQVELPALMRLYQQNTARSVGPVQRSEAYWRWLVSRRGFDRLFVAVEGPDKLDLETSVSQIVGYMVTKEDRILELMPAPGHPTVAAELLARACSEAIERDCHTVTLHAPPGDPHFELFRVAGGSQHCHEEHQGEVFMVKLIEPVALLRDLCPQLHERAERSGLPRPCELGLWVEGRKHRFVASRRSVKLERNRLGRSYLRMNQAELTRLLLGHVDLDESIAHGRMRASTRSALEIGRTLFPRLPLWRPPLDDLSC